MKYKIFVFPFFFFAASILLLGFQSNVEVNNVTSRCIAKNTSFSHGEVLHYKVYYNWKIVWVPAGEVKFTLLEDSLTYKYIARGKSYSSYDNFFRVNDYYETIIDKETMLPKAFVRHIEEGEYRKFDSLYFDHANLEVHSVNGKTRATAKAKTFPIDSCALDMLSVMYGLRNTETRKYNPGDALDITMFIDEEVYPIRVGYKKKERKTIKDLGKFNTLLIQPQLIVGNVFKEGDQMNIWVSDDKNKVPLLIESPISIGSVKAVLQSYSGLRHEGVLTK